MQTSIDPTRGTFVRRSFLTSLALIAAVLAASCVADGPTGPVQGGAAAANRGYGVSLPGSRRTAAIGSGQQTAINCIPRNPSYGTALIGAAGGDLIIGPHRLIVPPGALDHDVQISGTVPADKPFEINLEPHGLQFRKPAGLILDASSCTNVPTIVYLIDQLTVSDPIIALYSNFWHTIACPIWHFSGYSIAFNHDESDGS